MKLFKTLLLALAMLGVTAASVIAADSPGVSKTELTIATIQDLSGPVDRKSTRLNSSHQ